jgi:ATP-dependent Clp protease ATP-binding subunit ClpB
MLIEIERQSLKKEKDEQSKIRLDKIDKDLYDLKLQESKLKEDFEKEKKITGDILDKKRKLENLRHKLKEAENIYDLETAARLRHGEIPQLEHELEELQKNNNNKMISDTVDEEDIASIVSKWTGVPVSKLVEGEKEKLLSLEENMKKRVIGQDAALNKVYNAILRSRSGIKDPNKPIGSFLFLGPTGVGKTEVATTLSYELFDDERHMIRIDMSEYMEAFNVSRLIGAAPGYVGYEEGGQLTEAVRRNPYSIVLFDEIEKAHPDVFNILLQILDDGRITDSQGRTVDFKNTIIIMTSNLGGEYILENLPNKDELINRELHSTFKPEFLNRIDEIVFFNSLGKDVVYQILDKIIKEMEDRLVARNIKIKISDKAKEFIIDNSYDESYGARPIKRYVAQNVETLIAKELINGEIEDKSEILIDVLDNKIIIKK